MTEQRCEICGQDRVRRVTLDSRVMVLCKAHALRAKEGGAKTLDELRLLFVEREGRRALLPRRARDERRVFPPRPEGRRHDDGRRGSDPA